MKKLLFTAGILLHSSMPVFSQGSELKTPPGYTHLSSGIDYKFVKDKKGKKTANNGDFVLLHLTRKANGNVLFSSRALNDNQPVPYPVQDVQFAGDPAEVIKMLTKGDSIIIRVPMDSFVKAGMHSQDTSYKIQEMYISVIDVKTKQEMTDDAAKASAKQKKKDDKLISNYLKKHKINAAKTASGLYYTIESPGTGDTMTVGKVAMVMYIGKLLDGSIFDANMGKDAKHTDPLPVAVGQGKVIKGWDEGLMLLKKGSKATFYIPSPLAYGAQSPSPAIPANSVMIFNVEIKDVL